MRRYVEIPCAAGSVLVELQPQADAGGGLSKVGLADEVIIQAQAGLEAAFATARNAADAFHAQLQTLKSPPSEFELEFGLNLTGEAGIFAVSKVSAEANFSVTLKWTRESEVLARQPA